MPISLPMVLAKKEKGDWSKAEQTAAIAQSKAQLATYRSTMSANESIMQGLNEALEYAEGKEAGARTHAVEVPAVDSAAIGASTGLSQSAFARSIGVAKGTLLN